MWLLLLSLLFIIIITIGVYIVFHHDTQSVASASTPSINPVPQQDITSSSRTPLASKLTGVISSTSPLFCSNAFSGYPGTKSCGQGRGLVALYVEDDPGNETATSTWKNAKSGAIKAAYVALGSKSGPMKIASINTSAFGGQCQEYLNKYGGCIDWSNPATSAAAIAVAKKQIDMAASMGANAIRFDEMDVCHNNNGVVIPACQAGFNQALVQISHYIASKGLSIVGADDPTSVALLMKEQEKGGAKIVAAMTDSDQKYTQEHVTEMQKVVGPNIPILSVVS